MEFLDAILKSFKRENIEQIHLWSDSQITLYWIHRSIPKKGSLKVFVSNRVSNILEKTSRFKAKWHWISGLDNPADIASRGMTAGELADSETWWQGPEWISRNQEEWPKGKIELKLTSQELELAEVEIKGIHQVSVKEYTGLWRGPWYKSITKNGKAFPFLEAYNDWEKIEADHDNAIPSSTQFSKPREPIGWECGETRGVASGQMVDPAGPKVHIARRD